VTHCFAFSLMASVDRPGMNKTQLSSAVVEPNTENLFLYLLWMRTAYKIRWEDDTWETQAKMGG